MPRTTDDRLDRILESVQQLNVNLEGLRVMLEALAEAQADHERRLRVLERWRHSLTPILAALTFTLGAVVAETVKRLI
jgi:hypothetical protein